MSRPIVRRLTRIFPRLLLFNVLLVFLPVAGLLYLGTYERQLLGTQERSMVQQGRLLAAALGDSGTLEPAAAVALLERLERRVEARLRVVDRHGNLLADSSRLGPRREAGTDTDASPDVRGDWLYRLGAQATLLGQRLVRGPAPRLESSEVYGGSSTLDGDEIRAALAGRYGAATRISSGGQRSVTLYSAIPVRDGDSIVGAVLVSQSTSRILAALVEVRLDIFRTFLASVAVAVVLSLMFSATIARPLSRLQQQAMAIVDRRGRLKRRFEGSDRHDEIGELARALETLSGRIEAHQAKIEAFASDVAHELKNPLASIRTATELFNETDDPADRKRFLEMVERDVARMQHVLSEVRELALLDARHRPPAPVIDLETLAQEILAGYRARTDLGVDLELKVEGNGPRATIEPEHFARTLTNLLDNAISFSPADGEVVVELRDEGARIVLTVSDRGPGLTETDRSRVFDRFYSSRPDEHSGRGHLGLGLSIVRAIVESYGGDVTCSARESGGASFSVLLPAALSV